MVRLQHSQLLTGLSRLIEPCWTQRFLLMKDAERNVRLARWRIVVGYRRLETR